ncbi:DUF559 domain-containing protein [Corynebacterium imitans]|uniref:endonuclease domain-containing protein n=1 Tax=Corynebacterium imitans TaxID=156978 RepID=UPI001EF3B5CA|nr:DUF559 domain-containing protein [Corynebacterium imitans]MCG7278893.1 DUF559 domain-containing protein [Corynebacterium imitans]
MDRRALIALLVRPGKAHEATCRQLSASKFIAESDWTQLKKHEREFLRTYAAGTAAHKAVLVGRSAAIVSGIWTLPIAEDAVTLANPAHPAPWRAQWPRGVKYRSMRIPSTDYYSFSALPGDTIRTTTSARTAVDVARLHGVRHGVVAMDSLFYQAKPYEHERIRAELEDAVTRLTGKRGIAHARKALTWCSTKSQSPYESLLRVVLRQRGIAVEEQMWIGRYARPDLLWGQLVIEVDGDAKFAGNGQAAALEQLARENWIRMQHYDVIRVTPRELLRNEERVVREILDLKEHSSLLDAPLTPATHSRPISGEDWRRQAG